MITRPGQFAFVLTLLLNSAVWAQESVLPERHHDGEAWFRFDGTVHASANGAHGGWDFYDGDAKQFWVGTGWKMGQDHRGRWGLWSPQGQRSQFALPIQPGKPVSFIGKIDFGASTPGDESLQLWHTEVKEANLIAALDKLSLSGVDRARQFVARGGDYELSAPIFEGRSTESYDGNAHFAEVIRPLFAQKCMACHGDDPDKIKGDFDMRTREGLLLGGESGSPGLIPNDAEGSLLYVAATWQDDSLEMPPKENDRLTERELESIRTWITHGAPWPEAIATRTNSEAGKWSQVEGAEAVRIGTSGGLNDAWTQRTYASEDVWAFRQRSSPSPPQETQNPIDAFIDAKMKSAGLPPAERATDQALQRRLAYDLTGLPLSSNDAQLSLEQLIAALLDSPHYGERMAQHWLDVVRYADSNGFSRDEIRPDAHRYRTYVIESFNADKPFDQFVREQIAGDELGLAGQEALSFLWMGPWEFTNMTSAAVARQMWLDDVVNSVGVTFLGQELRCAKCHDHKFDPIPTRDYYSFQAVFASTKHHRNKGEFQIQRQNAQSISILKGGALESPLEKVQPGMLSAVSLSNGFTFPETDSGKRAVLADWIASPDNPLTARVIVNRVWQWHFGQGLVATPNNFGVNGSKPSHPELLDWLANWFVENDWSLKALHQLILTSDAYQRSTKHPKPDLLADLDPDNRLLAVFNPRRLSAEELRDSMLAASGELNRQVGGASFKDEINWEVAFQPRLAMGKLVPPWEPDPSLAERSRRSLYAMRVRNLGHPLMEVFNLPVADLSCEKRDETTVVTQAFTLFHSEFTYQRALALAHRIVDQVGTDTSAAQIEASFRNILGRTPSPAEMRRCQSHLQEMLVHHRQNPPTENPLPTEVALTNVIEKTGEEEVKTFKLTGMTNYERPIQPWQTSAEARALAELHIVLFNSSEFLHVY